MKVLVIIPALNEQDAIPGVLHELDAARPQLDASIEMVVVDDGSIDRTSEVARAHGARVASLCHNLGIGGAVQTGLRLARREGFDCAVQLDGDGQHPPEQLAALLAEFARGGTDLVIGSRYLERDADNFRSTRLRRLGSRWLSVLLRLVAGVSVSDPTSGFRLYGPRALELFDRTYPCDYPEPEAIAVARACGLTIREVPVKMRARQAGASSISLLLAPYYMLKVTTAVILTNLRASWRTRRRGA